MTHGFSYRGWEVKVSVQKFTFTSPRDGVVYTATPHAWEGESKEACAIRVMRDVSELPYDARRVRNLAEKKAVVREAAKLLEPGETIYLDASSTALQMASLLGDKPLRVITNAHLILNLLSQHDRIKLISTGGNLNRRNYGFEGPAALRAAILSRWSLPVKANGIRAATVGREPAQAGWESAMGTVRRQQQTV